jgi:hypothetical protein
VSGVARPLAQASSRITFAGAAAAPDPVRITPPLLPRGKGEDKAVFKQRLEVAEKCYVVVLPQGESETVADAKLRLQIQRKAKSTFIWPRRGGTDPESADDFEARVVGLGAVKRCSVARQSSAEANAGLKRGPSSRILKRMMTSGGAIQRPGETTLHAGWMMKRGPKALDGWKRRWFVLRGSRMLEYFTNEEMEVQKGEVSLREIKSQDAFDFKPGSSVFTFKAQGRTWKVNAGTKEACAAWETKLRATVK